jgi:hypothetical protein
MTNKPELLPCGFCANPNPIISSAEEKMWKINYHKNAVKTKKFKIECSCGISTPQFNSLFEVIRFWNTRAKPTVSLGGLTNVLRVELNQWELDLIDGKDMGYIKIEHVLAQAALTHLQEQGVQIDVKD